MSGLDRFVTAQADVYDIALGELIAGRKRSHWMWFVFPQIAGLGSSPTAQYYAIADLAEARAYLAHPLLGPRLIGCADAMLGWAGRRSAVDVLGAVDAMKFRSCCTLFEAAGFEAAGFEAAGFEAAGFEAAGFEAAGFEAAGGAAAGGAAVFAACLDAFFDGARDAATMRLIG